MQTQRRKQATIVAKIPSWKDMRQQYDGDLLARGVAQSDGEVLYFCCIVGFFSVVLL
jgi:hypothetical protein